MKSTPANRPRHEKSASGGHIPRKRFGQNFLVNKQIVIDIVAALHPARDDRVVEIGPGLGALTEPLLDALDHLQVVEIDRDLIARLKRHYPPARLTIHAGDVLAFDFLSLAQDPAHPLRVVGNLPYNISTPLLFHLDDAVARQPGSIRDMHFMLQKEVVERMVAAPGESARGRLSVMLQYRFHLEWLLDVPPDSFDPPPQVDSAVVRLIPRAPGELSLPDRAAEARFGEIVAAAFSQRRKMLRNTLKGRFSSEQLVAAGIDPTARAEDLDTEAFVRLAGLPLDA